MKEKMDSPLSTGLMKIAIKVGTRRIITFEDNKLDMKLFKLLPEKKETKISSGSF